jgi:hypothetical protein
MLTRRELLLLCLVFVVSIPAVTTRLYASDEIEYFAWLRSIAFDRDVDFQNEYQYFYDAGISRSAEFHETFLERTNEAGRRINYAPPGCALLWAPFYGVGHAVALATGAPADGFSRPYIAAVAYGSACYGFLAVLLSASIARRVVGRGVGASLAVAAGTPLLFYAYLAPGFGHAASAFAVSLFVWVWLRVRARWTVRGAMALGLCAGLMGLVREQDLFLAAGPAVDFLWSWLAARPARPDAARPSWLAAAAGAGAFAVAFAPVLLAYIALNGHPGATETAARKMTWTGPHALAVLFSLEHGLFAWTPLALVCVAGLIALWWRGPEAAKPRDGVADPDARRIALLALLMVALQAYTSGSVESWTVAGSFGQRRFVALTPLLVLGLAAIFSLARSGWPRRALVAVVVLCVWWNLGLMAQFGLNRMDRQRLTLAGNARATFLELPLEAPVIAWRYLTDRSSLYKLPPASQER